MATPRLLILASRPKTLFASVAPVFIGICFSMSHGALSPFIMVLTLLTAVLIQISCNFANDYFDAIKGADTAERKGPLRITASGLILKQKMLQTMCVIFLAAAICGSLLSYYGGAVIAILTGISLILALVYTAGPFPLAYQGLGEFFVLTFFGPIATFGTYYMQTHSFSWESVLIGLIPGAFSSAILVVNNLRDIEEDAKACKKTLAVRFGEEFAKKEYFFLIAGAYAILAGFSFFYPFMALGFLTLPLGVKLCKKMRETQEKTALNPLLFETSKLLFFSSVLLSIGRMLC